MCTGGRVLPGDTFCEVLLPVPRELPIAGDLPGRSAGSEPAGQREGAVSPLPAVTATAVGGLAQADTAGVSSPELAAQEARLQSDLRLELLRREILRKKENRQRREKRKRRERLQLQVKQEVVSDSEHIPKQARTISSSGAVAACSSSWDVFRANLLSALMNAQDAHGRSMFQHAARPRQNVHLSHRTVLMLTQPEQDVRHIHEWCNAPGSAVPFGSYVD